MDNEAELVHRSLRGDRLAFTRLIEMHQTNARRVATAMVGTGGDADDVVQDAFVKAYTRLHQFDPSRSFKAWLLTIVTNEARNRHRSAGRRNAMALRVAGRRDMPIDDPADRAVADERRERLAQAMAALPERDREVVALRYFAQLSEAETAAVLGCAPGTAKSRLSRALVRLRTSLAEEVTR